MTKSDDQIIRETLVTCRNFLLSGVHKDGMRDALVDAISRLRSVGVDSTRQVLEAWLPEVLRLIESGELQTSASMLNFLHNLPITVEEARRWNVNYFLVFELPIYLRSVDIDSIPTELVLIALREISKEALLAAKDRPNGFLA